MTEVACAATVGLLVVAVFARRFEPQVGATLAMYVMSAAAALALPHLVPLLVHDGHPPVHLPQLPGWTAWPILAGVPSLAVAVGLVRATRPADPPLAGWCARCGADLCPDQTGYRYHDPVGRYLCPPEHWRPNDRRHQLAVTPLAPVGDR
jgi:hypothetical protein